MVNTLILLFLLYSGPACLQPNDTNTAASKQDISNAADSGITRMVKPDNAVNKDTALLPPARVIITGNTQPEEVVKFAESLMGTPYVYAATDPGVGFDCSGFITYVFNHFKIAVPRSSIDFTEVGRTVDVAQAKMGDLILFTGTNPAERKVGHMGLVIANTGDSLQFIHSSSGKAMGVTITPLNGYYKTRFVRISRIFPEKG